ncbi:hypothetical protein [Lewinella sp. W8]|uniref:hypothetical protein n=1 Tax=Lewinella sp. W8 TaxID=2528208 RepID=UPI001067DD81|nr:hypothetical protein [Lewinella sp. W8]MTB53052.1 hypothetical protein [Lewinella sp. W8]
MTTTSPPVSRTIIKSTNFNVQALIPLLVAIGALFGIDPDVTLTATDYAANIGVTVVGAWYFLREQFKDGLSLTWNSNVLFYIIAFLANFVPWIVDYPIQETASGLIEALASGDFSLILTSLFAVGNIVYKIIQDRRNASSGGQPAPAR